MLDTIAFVKLKYNMLLSRFRSNSYFNRENARLFPREAQRSNKNFLEFVEFVEQNEYLQTFGCWKSDVILDEWLNLLFKN